MNQLIATLKDNDDGYVHCEIIEASDNTSRRKSIRLTLNDFISALINEVDVTELHPLELPENYVSIKIGNNISKKITGQISFIIKAEKRVITYCNETFLIPFPDLLFDFTFKQGKLINDAVWAVTKKGELAFFPFTNVHADGHICWGNARIPEIDNFKSATVIAELFLRYPMNTDLANNNSLLKAKVSSMGDFFKLLQTKTVFPQKYLQTTGKTVQDI